MINSPIFQLACAALQGGMSPEGVYEALTDEEITFSDILEEIENREIERAEAKAKKDQDTKEIIDDNSVKVNKWIY